MSVHGNSRPANLALVHLYVINMQKRCDIISVLGSSK
jgi:hypothetical protein